MRVPRVRMSRRPKTGRTSRASLSSRRDRVGHAGSPVAARRQRAALQQIVAPRVEGLEARTVTASLEEGSLSAVRASWCYRVNVMPETLRSSASVGAWKPSFT